MNKPSDALEETINNAIKNYDGSYELGDPFEEVAGLAELADKLMICNAKLYNLKDAVMRKQNDERFRAWASVEDVKLVMERSRLKKAIDLKVVAMIEKGIKGIKNCGIGEEVKKYG